MSPARPDNGLAGFASPLAFTGVRAPIGFARADKRRGGGSV